MKEMYFTIAGCSHYFGSQFMEKGMKVKLVKEPDNEYDREAIQVLIKGLGKCGYVANSPSTVKGESMSAGRLYDKLGSEGKDCIRVSRHSNLQDYRYRSESAERCR